MPDQITLKMTWEHFCEFHCDYSKYVGIDMRCTFDGISQKFESTCLLPSARGRRITKHPKGSNNGVIGDKASKKGQDVKETKK